jgi:hypothetical protein
MALIGLARALDRGLRAAIGILVLAIAGAVLFPEAQGERLATTAYLAAIFAAVMLFALRCLPKAERLRIDRTERSIAGTIAFWVVVVGALAAAASAAGRLAGEVLVCIACTLVVLAAAIFPIGIAALVHRELAKGGALMVVARYAALASAAGWALSAYVHADNATAAVFGFAAFVIACILELAASRPLRDLICGTSLATVVAFAVAGCVPAFAGSAAAVGYAAAVTTMALLVLRERYA